MSNFRTTAVTLAVALIGGLIAQWFHLPAALLVGGAVLVSVVTLLGVRTAIPTYLRDTAFVVVGMTLGTNVAQDSLSLMAQWPVTLIGLAVAMALIVVTTTLVLHKTFGLDRGTAYLSSFPGHLSFVIGVAESGYGDSRQIAVIQCFRVLLLTAIVPIVARFYTSTDLSILPQGQQMALSSVAFLAASCAAGGFVFRAMKVPAAFVLGSMLVATTGKLMGLYSGQLPALMTLFGFLVMGAFIGSRFSGTTADELRRMAVAGVAGALISLGIVSAVAFALSRIVDMPLGQIWLGLAPGGLETMGALAVALGFDTAFIAAHHTARFFMLILTIPTVAVVVRRAHQPPMP